MQFTPGIHVAAPSPITTTHNTHTHTHKDVFWSTAEQPGNPYSPQTREAKPALEAAIATLSAGPVAPGDKIGLEDRELILRACRADGKILKPSRPLTTLDSVHAERAFAGDGGPHGVVMGTYALLPLASARMGCSAVRCV